MHKPDISPIRLPRLVSEQVHQDLVSVDKLTDCVLAGRFESTLVGRR